jgi:hypothetical protein
MSGTDMTGYSSISSMNMGGMTGMDMSGTSGIGMGSSMSGMDMTV